MFTYVVCMSDIELHTIDTHAMVKDLIAAGFTEKQAEAQVSTLSRFISYNLATKHDLEEVRRDLKTDIEKLRKETKTDIAEVKRDIAEVKRDVEGLRKETKTDIELLRRDLTNLILKTQIAGVGIILAAIAAFKLL